MIILAFVPAIVAGLLWYYGGPVGQAIVVGGIVHGIVLVLGHKVYSESEKLVP